MFDPSLAGRIATVVTKPELVEKDPKHHSTYYDGEYFVLRASKGTLTCVKPVGGYGGHDTRSFTALTHEVIDSYDDKRLVEDWLEDLEDFAATPKRAEKLRWVESVYTDAGSIARQARRVLARRAEPTQEEVVPQAAAVYTYSGIFLVKGNAGEIAESVDKARFQSRFMEFESTDGSAVLIVPGQVSAVTAVKA